MLGQQAVTILHKNLHLVFQKLSGGDHCGKETDRQHNYPITNGVGDFCHSCFLGERMSYTLQIYVREIYCGGLKEESEYNINGSEFLTLNSPSKSFFFLNCELLTLQST